MCNVHVVCLKITRRFAAGRKYLQEETDFVLSVHRGAKKEFTSFPFIGLNKTPPDGCPGRQGRIISIGPGNESANVLL